MTVAQNNQQGARVRFPPPLVFLGFIFCGLALQYGVLPLSLPLGRMVLFIAGALFGVAGLALNMELLVLFKRSGQNPAPWKPTPSLILRGPYRCSRNPMYVSLTLIQAGIGLAINNMWITLCCFPSLLVVHYIAVLPEEEYLAGRFGESYRNYRDSVRRYL